MLFRRNKKEVRMARWNTRELANTRVKLPGSLGTLNIHLWGGLHGLAFVEPCRFVGQNAIGFRMLGGHDFFVFGSRGR